MKNKFILTAILAMAVVFLAGITFQDSVLAKSPVKDHLITVKKVNGAWKVIHTVNGKKATVRAKRNDIITWVVEGTDAHFQFMDTKIFGFGTRTVKKGKKLILPVKPNAPKGTHKYSVYCTSTPAGFATENSPPVIIIE